MNDERPDADREGDAPHPREAARLFGQAAAEAAFQEAARSGRLHHAWLLTGPRGVGKATLAYRIAHAVLTGRADALDRDGTPVARRIRAGSEPGLFVLRREWDDKKGRMPAVINVDQIRGSDAPKGGPRGIAPFLHLSAPDGGRRVIIIDAADEMNVEAANALLKLLEEPPARTVLLLVAHQPWRLLPTIRSRCRELRLSPLASGDLAAALAQAGVEGDADALAALSGGSPGEAVRLASGGGAELYTALLGVLSRAPGMDRAAMLRLAEGAAGRGNADRLSLLIHLAGILMARLARAGAAGPPRPEAAPGEAATLARLAPSPAAGRLWAEAQAALGARMRHGQAVNLDPAALTLDMLRQMDEAAARAATLAPAPPAPAPQGAA